MNGRLRRLRRPAPQEGQGAPSADGDATAHEADAPPVATSEGSTVTPEGSAATPPGSAAPPQPEPAATTGTPQPEPGATTVVPVVDQPTVAQPAVASDATPPEADPATATAPDESSPGPALPAGAPPPQGKLSFRDRGMLRRRLRFLRRVRELGFRDLGGLVFDQHRFGRINEELVSSKLAALQAVDDELRTVAVLLDDVRPVEELREPGVAACARCGALHGSEARFCPSCGLDLRAPVPVAAAPPAATAEPPGA